jgi:putative ABC transport system substrate-binding protein
MLFQGAEKVSGLTIHRFAADYHADQTESLGFLPGVPAKRGVELDINLQVWIEPVSGTLVKYEDNTIAYYYDIKSGKRLHPWNKFRNRYTDTSLKEHVRLAQLEKWKILGIDVIVPATLALGAILALVAVLIKWRRGGVTPPLHLQSTRFIRRRYFIAATLLLVIVASTFLFSQKQKQIIIGVAQWGSNPDYERNIMGFKDALAAKGHQEKKNIPFLQRLCPRGRTSCTWYQEDKTVRFLHGNAEMDIEKQREIIASFVREEVSLIYALTTPGTLVAKAATKTIPIVFSMVTYPVETNVIRSLESSENNLVGTRDYISPARQYFALERLYPHAKTLAFIHRAGEPNSVIQLNQFEQLLEGRKGVTTPAISVIDIAGVNIQDINAQLNDHLQKVDALFLSCDTLIQAGGEEIGIAFGRLHKKPVHTCNNEGINKGALIGNVADLYLIGKMAGEKAALILNGVEPKWLHTESQPNDNILINQKTANDFGLVIPSDLRAIAASIITK